MFVLHDPILLIWLFSALLAFLLLKHCKRNGSRAPKPNALAMAVEVGVSLKRRVTEPLSQTVPPSQSKAEKEAAELRTFKVLYFKLQHLENFPEVLPQAREMLIKLFAEALSNHRRNRDPGILALQDHSKLGKFVQSGDDKVGGEWKRYIARRKSGGTRELFQDRDEAVWWLRQLAPVKYVDGAWLGHIHRPMMPFSLQRIIKTAFQVLSEELGDGDLTKNHAYIYHKLMSSVATDLPRGDSLEFTHTQHHLDQLPVWKAAVGQLLISLFPHEFLPEILGFNLHFEGVSLETLMAAKELKEVKLDPSYFLLHISIDNADTGHTAMAMQAVCDYMDHVSHSESAVVAAQTWRRLQAGYILSQGLPHTTVCPSMKKSVSHATHRTDLEGEVIKIFQAKARVAQQTHCGTAIRIGGRKLADWLDSETFDTERRQMDLLDELSNMRFWIHKGDSSKSRFMNALLWGGKMFGAFTQAECDTVKKWIDMMPTSDPKQYWEFTGRDENSAEVLSDHDITTTYPCFIPGPAVEDLLGSWTRPCASLPAGGVPTDFTITAAGPIQPSKFFPICFTHQTLLSAFIIIPFKNTNLTNCSILKILRAQAGFDIESDGVAGMDEVRRSSSISLADLGREMLRNCGLPDTASARAVVEAWPCDFAELMLHLSMRPERYGALLVGMAAAFAGLHGALAEDEGTLLGTGSRDILREITRREMDGLAACLQEFGKDEKQHEEVWKGYSVAKAAIEQCFGIQDVE